MDLYNQWSEARTKIPPGQYHIKCLNSDRPKIWLEGAKGWGELENRVILWFQIVEGAQNGKIIPMFLNLPTDKDGKLKNKISDGHRYYDAWRIANGGERPPRARFKEMNPSKFLNKSFIAEVVDVKPTWLIPSENGGKPKKKEKPEIFWYSRVLCLYELLTGNPKN